MPQTITFAYRNHRGIISPRTVDVTSLEFIRQPGFGYQSGWFVSGRCHDKDTRRSFALNSIVMDANDVPLFFTLMKL